MVKSKCGHRKPYVQAVFGGLGLKEGDDAAGSRRANRRLAVPPPAARHPRGQRACVYGRVQQAKPVGTSLPGQWKLLEESAQEERARRSL